MDLVADTTALTEFDVKFYTSKNAARVEVSLTNCKAVSGSGEIPQEGELTETLDFRAKSFSIVDSS